MIAFLYREMANADCQKRILHKQHQLIGTESIEMLLNKGEAVASQLQQQGFSDVNLEIYFGTLYVWRSKLETYRGNLDRAVELIDTAESEFVRLGYPNTLDRGAVADARALIHAAKGEYEKEIEYLKESIGVYSSGFSASYRPTIERAIRLATAYQNNNQPDEAIQILTKYQKIAMDVYGKDASLTMIICDHLEKLQQS